MRGHTANDLKFLGDILAPDGVTVIVTNIRCGVDNLTGARREQAQLRSADVTSMILFRAGVIASALSESGFVRVDGQLYVVDYFIDPDVPRPGVWREVYCHRERTPA